MSEMFARLVESLICTSINPHSILPYLLSTAAASVTLNMWLNKNNGFSSRLGVKKHIPYPGRGGREHPTDTCLLGSVDKLRCCGRSSDTQAYRNNALYFQVLLWSYWKYHHSSGCGSGCSKELWTQTHTDVNKWRPWHFPWSKGYKWSIFLV